MSARKAKTPVRSYDAFRGGVAPSSARKKNTPRAPLTHLEVRRGDTLRLRIAVADDALAEVGDELGALIKKVAPSTQTSVVTAEPTAFVMSRHQADTDAVPDLGTFVVARQHEGDGNAYHANLREHFSEMFSALCDTSLADVLEIAREERARRAEGGN
jgi:hypothetical protein